MIPHATSKRILAVDDIPFNLEIVASAFEEVRPPVETLTAGDGRRALDLLRDGPPVDVVLLDLEMPGLSGYDVLREMRADVRLAYTPVVVVTSNGEEKKKALGLGATDFVTKPFDVEELRLRCLNYLDIKKYHDLLTDSRALLEAEVARRTTELADALRLAKQNEYEIALRLGRAAEHRDAETGHHIVRMSRMSARLAELAGLSPAEVELVLYASPLHDVGKIGIADAILLKAGRLTAEEFAVMKQHTLIGGAILAEGARCPVVEAGRIIAEQHHEKWDGSGYPCGLVGESIHVFGRIVAIADVFDALTSKRVYKPAMALDEALRIMTEGRGKHFDPQLLDLFVASVDDFMAIRHALPDV